MQIEDSFRVDLPIDDAWRLLLDIERIAPCLPGAQLTEIEGDEYRGAVKVKVGPITAQYKGTARLEQVDETAYTAVIVGNGRDTRGQGNASATIKLSLHPDGEGSRVVIDTDLAITGKVAQFGRGVMADVSAKLLAKFVENLERDVLVDEASGTAIAVDSLEVDAIVTDSAAVGGVRVLPQRDIEPVQLLELGASPTLKRYGTFLLAGVIFFSLVWLVRRRRRIRA
ncbi:MAG: hypothetical protein EXQ69_01910 [Acidimicrobiia bacterium]|nr:hypothetical protein [Acidimicrobiia bacterium]